MKLKKVYINNSDQPSNAIWGRNMGSTKRQEKRIVMGINGGCAEWHANIRSGTNTSEGQREWRRLPKNHEVMIELW